MQYINKDKWFILKSFKSRHYEQARLNAYDSCALPQAGSDRYIDSVPAEAVLTGRVKLFIQPFPTL